MKLVSHESIFVDVNANEESVVQTVVYEASGYGKIGKCFSWFEKSPYKRILVVATEDEYPTPSQLARAFYNKVVSRDTQVFTTMKYNKVYLEKTYTKEGATNGRTPNVHTKDN